MPHITLRELVHDTAAVHGWRFAATYWRKRVCFTHFYWLAFGRLPRAAIPERSTCGTCGNKYFPHEQPTDCLTCL